MALLDRERGLIVLRVVYDGPPEAGKTTSLRALGGSLGQPLHTPVEEHGRTLFFDWMDYTGGRFEGYELRCQIVSVPGQPEYHARRLRLLSEADVVVFVADTTVARLDESLEMLRALPPLVASVLPPPLGVVLQANKRDRWDAVPLVELREAVRRVTPAAIVESVAADGTGIREAFVLSVRLALDRVREQLRTHTLAAGTPEIDSADALYAAMREVPRTIAAAAAPLVAQVLAENLDLEVPLVPWQAPDLESALLAASDGPAPPDASAPAGAIWPPVEGRLVLHEATSGPLAVRRIRSGGFTATLGEAFRIYSAESASFSDLDSGRETLVRWARLHAACAGLLSPHRCIVLAATGHGTWRLWQIVRSGPSLREQLDDLERLPTPEAAARILDVATLLADADAAMQRAHVRLPCSLDTIGRGERGAVYVGLMPMERDLGATPAMTSEFRRELESIVNASGRRDEVLAVLARGPRGRLVLEQIRGAQ